MARQVAFLRGINVGAHRRVPMARVQEVVRGVGYDGVTTYLQSGNVVYETGDEPPVAAARLEEAFGAGLGFDVGVVVRDAVELAAVLAHDPLRAAVTDDSRYLVAFLAEAPPKSIVDELERLGTGDQLRHRGRELYLWCPDGIHASQIFTALTPRRLGGAVTARNWRVVGRLAELAGAEPQPQ